MIFILIRHHKVVDYRKEEPQQYNLCRVIQQRQLLNETLQMLKDSFSTRGEGVQKRGCKRRATFQTTVGIFRCVTLQIVLAEKSSSLHMWFPRWDYVNDKLMNVNQKQGRKNEVFGPGWCCSVS